MCQQDSKAAAILHYHEPIVMQNVKTVPNCATVITKVQLIDLMSKVPQQI